MQKYGAKTWFIPDCYYPEVSSPGHYVSHEAICVLNTGKVDSTINITLYFEDQDPLTGFTAECPAERTRHIRLDLLKDANGRSIPKGVPYAVMVESSEPIIVQYSRLDTTQAEL